MKYKLFEEYTEQQNGHPGFLQSKEEIHAWLKKYNWGYSAEKYTITNSGGVIAGKVDSRNKDMNYILVNYYSSSACYLSNCNLNTLKGSPNHVDDNFICSGNNLITLEYAPDYVVGDFWCGSNDLITLGHKSKIKGRFEHDELQGSLGERWNRYRNYIETLDGEDKKSSLQWLYDVDEEFRELVVRYSSDNNIVIDAPGINWDIASDALKHKDSGLF